MKEYIFNANQVIFKQGSYSECMYDIVKGKVGIFSHYGEQDEKKIAELGSDEIFGEMGMIAVFARSATAVALEDGTVVNEISEADLKEYFKDKPEKLLKIMRQLSGRLRETTQNYVNACRVVYETDENNKNGAEPSDWLAEQVRVYSEIYYDSMFNE